MGRHYKRIFLVVIDSLGIGSMADAADYGDEGADTFGHIVESVKRIHIPTLQKLGLVNLHPTNYLKKAEAPLGYRLRMNELSKSKDTMTGHWEMMGLNVRVPFRTFTEKGFPEELLTELSRRCNKRIIGNRAASGTDIIEELGEEEINTGAMIVYTSADSVMQICGNEETFDLQELYRCCQVARELTMKEEWKVGRIIARPYVGKRRGEFKRTSNRHDYALKPFGKVVLNSLQEQGFDVISVGKIKDIFDGEGITKAFSSTSSVHGMEQTIGIAGQDFEGLCFVNLVDFDALWGHRRDPLGYAGELERFDAKLDLLMHQLKADDLLMITADHGNDPTFKGTDHTREMVPLLLYSPSMEAAGQLSDAASFADAGATIADNFRVEMPDIGRSVLASLR